MAQIKKYYSKHLLRAYQMPDIVLSSLHITSFAIKKLYYLYCTNEEIGYREDRKTSPGSQN